MQRKSYLKTNFLPGWLRGKVKWACIVLVIGAILAGGRMVSSGSLEASTSAGYSSSTIATSSSSASPSTISAEKAIVSRVVDGDTLVVSLSSGSEAKVRLIGVDAPESVNPDASKNTEAGSEASSWTKSQLPAGTEVWLQKDVSDTDKYGRLLRYVWLADPSGGDLDPAQSMFNALLVSSGHAVAKDYAPDTAYSSLFHSLE